LLKIEKRILTIIAIITVIICIHLAVQGRLYEYFSWFALASVLFFTFGVIVHMFLEFVLGMMSDPKRCVMVSIQGNLDAKDTVAMKVDGRSTMKFLGAISKYFVECSSGNHNFIFKHNGNEASIDVEFSEGLRIMVIVEEGEISIETDHYMEPPDEYGGGIGLWLVFSIIICIFATLAILRIVIIMR